MFDSRYGRDRPVQPDHEEHTYLSELVDLQLPLGPIFILLDRAQQKVDLGDDNFGQGAGPGRTARTRPCASTENTSVQWMGRMITSGLEGLRRIGRK